MTKTKNKKEVHVHKLQRVSDNYASVWRCMDPYCSYTLYRAQEIFLIGKATKCTSCDAEFKFSKADLEFEFPQCLACRNPDIIDLWDEASTQIAHKNLSIYKEPKDPTEH